MKFCPVVPEICRGQVHGPRKERKKERKRIIIIIIIRNGAKTISLQTLFEDLIIHVIIIIRRNGAKTISLQTLFGRLNNILAIFNGYQFLFVEEISVPGEHHRPVASHKLYHIMLYQVHLA
jgi:predicted  nucleic acid-binding Zn-ribbon protein